MSELKPCPFCGGQAEYVTSRIKDGHCSYSVGYVECQACLSQTGLFGIDGYYGTKAYTEKEICERWNRRVLQTVVKQYGENCTHISNCGTLNLNL